MKITTKQVGARMREARKKKKYTLRYLANKIGLSSGSTISNWELGLNLPNKRYLKKIAKACDTTVDWLLYGDFDRFVRQLMRIFIFPTCPKSEYKASAPVVAKKIFPKINRPNLFSGLTSNCKA